MIQQERLFEFVNELHHIQIEEEDDQKLWDIWLHRVFDKTFEEWKDQISTQQINAQASESEIGATVLNSKNILNGFNPEDGR